MQLKWFPTSREAGRTAGRIVAEVLVIGFAILGTLGMVAIFRDRWLHGATPVNVPW